MNACHVSQKYEKGFDKLLQFAPKNGKLVKGTYYCPCVRCLNKICQELWNICDHLFYLCYYQELYNIDMI